MLITEKKNLMRTANQMLTEKERTLQRRGNLKSGKDLPEDGLIRNRFGDTRTRRSVMKFF